MKIRPTDETLRQVFERGFYVIPRFQRPYSWEREHVEDFWDDAIATDDADYFIGSMVVFPNSQNRNTYSIVDGQQRLTTITLLLAALRNAFRAIHEDELARGTQGLLERRDIDNQLRYVLHSESPYPFLQEYIQKYDPPELEPSRGQEEDRLEAAFRLLEQKVDGAVASVIQDSTIREDKRRKLAAKKLSSIRDKLLGLLVVLLSLDNEDDAYLIFETLNTRGKDLGVSDLVKNHLTRLLRPTNRGVDQPRQKWHDIQERFDASSQQIDINKFIHHSWLSRREYVPQKKLFRLLKLQINRNNARAFLDELVADSKLYRAIIEPAARDWARQEADTASSLRALRLFGVEQSIPFALAVLRAYDAGVIALKATRNALRTLENFHYIFTAITGQRAGGGAAQMYALAARSLTGQTESNGASRALNEFRRKLKERVPPRAEFDATFAQLLYLEDLTKHRDLLRYSLARLQASDGVLSQHDLATYTIEHLYPQNPASGDRLPAEVVGRIGNLLLVPEGLNERLRNRSFGEKLAIFRETGVQVPDSVTQASSWGEPEIIGRSERLAEAAYERVWSV